MRIDPTLSYQGALTALHPPGRGLVPVPRPPVPAVALPAQKPAPAEPPIAELFRSIDVRNLTPRQAAEFGMDLHVAGVLPWEEYAMLAFQPELHPDYDRTVGALIGEKAQPDRPRDFVAMWQERLAFERKYNAGDPKLIARTARIVTVLRQIETPTSVVV